MRLRPSIHDIDECLRSLFHSCLLYRVDYFAHAESPAKTLFLYSTTTALERCHVMLGLCTRKPSYAPL